MTLISKIRCHMLPKYLTSTNTSHLSNEELNYVAYKRRPKVIKKKAIRVNTPLFSIYKPCNILFNWHKIRFSVHTWCSNSGEKCIVSNTGIIWLVLSKEYSNKFFKDIESKF